MKFSPFLRIRQMMFTRKFGGQSSDYYESLGVSHDAKPEDIKRAYKKKALQYHPEKNKSADNSYYWIFSEISEAYQILSNPEARVSSLEKV